MKKSCYGNSPEKLKLMFQLLVFHFKGIDYLRVLFFIIEPISLKLGMRM